jgi:hypothetical protein
MEQVREDFFQRRVLDRYIINGSGIQDFGQNA